MSEAPAVRFVIVAWGRTETLDACLDALAPACDGLAFEAVVVLSPGDPAAARVARRARVVTPAPGEPHTPGANRNRGAAGAQASYLGFVDGDVVLEPGAVRAAVAHLEAHPGDGGAGGRVHERQWEGTRLVREIPDSYRVGRGGPVEMLATAWVARRAAFEAVGGFDPRLPAEEDVELGLRLNGAGWRLFALDARGGYHDCPPRPSLAEFRRRFRTGLYAGQGLLLRYAWGTPLFGRHLRRQRLFLAALGWALLGAALAAAVAVGAAWAHAPFAVWLLGSLAGTAVMAWRKRSVTLGVLAVVTWVVQGVSIVHAWLVGPREAGR